MLLLMRPLQEIKMFKLIFKILCISLCAPMCFSQEINLDSYRPLVGDVKSYKVGEPVIVIVVEATTAEASAGTGVEKNTGINASLNENDKNLSAGMNVDSNNEGGGKTSRRGKVTTQLSATIMETLPEGILKINGTQDITINGEKQQIMVSGLIRSSDISKSNSIFSYQIANVELEIVGDGDVSKAQKQNIFYRFFNWVGIL